MSMTLLRRAYSYVFRERNPLTQVLYVALVVCIASAALFGPGEGESETQERAAVVVAAVVALASFVVACRSDPGVVTAANVGREMARFAFDNVLFHDDGSRCRTCERPKPPRSKHCRLCDRCVWRFDHHCPWIDNCVGGANLGVFVSFLGVTVAALGAASHATLASLLRFAARERVWEARFELADGTRVPVTRWVAFKFVNYHRPAVVMAALASCVLLPVVGAFAVHTLWQAARNVTSNETAKRDSLAAVTDEEFGQFVAEQAGRADVSLGEVRARKAAFLKQVRVNAYSRGGLAGNLRDAFGCGRGSGSAAGEATKRK